MKGEHQCQQCGMSYPEEQQCCPKCDYGRHEQNRLCTLEVDIAHDLQTVDQAVDQFHGALAQARRELYRELRLIVGGGLINREVGRLLETELQKKSIRSYGYERHNRGAYLVQL